MFKPSQPTNRMLEMTRRRERRLLIRRRVIESLEPRRLLAFDFGDAPDTGVGTGPANYETLVANNGPRHRIDTTQTLLFLGARVDSEPNAIPNITADGDDRFTLPSEDDEDGLVESERDLQLTVGTVPIVRVRATNLTGGAATLFGWIDVDRDGVFDNATERASVAVPTGAGNEVYRLNFPAIPFGTSTGSTYARFRLSTFAEGANPIGEAGNGEVEDYAAAITRASEDSFDTNKTKRIFRLTNGGPELSTNDRWGAATANIGDVDGDGIDDLAVGATYATPTGFFHILFMNEDGTAKGNRKLASGLSGMPVLTNTLRFGSSIASIGDLDGDGRSEIAIGDFGEDPNALGSSVGAVYVLFLNSDGTVRHSTKIGRNLNGGPNLNNFESFGKSLASIGDLDNDGISEMAVGAFGIEPGGPYSQMPSVYILYMNANGTAKASVQISNGINGGPTIGAFSRFGRGLASLGDLDGDGFPELAVGATGEASVFVLFLNSNGTVKSSRRISSGFEGGPVFEGASLFGSSLATIGDVDADGVVDIAVGADNSTSNGIQSGAVFLLLMKPDGTAKRAIKIGNGENGGPVIPSPGQDNFGSSIASLGDLDHDGSIELAIGAYDDGWPGLTGGAVYILFGTPDTIGPVLSSIQRQTPSIGNTNADSLVFRLTFSEEVRDVDATDFVIDGTTDATVSNVSVVASNVYDVTISGGDLSSFMGTVGLNLAFGQNIRDRAGYLLPTTEPAIDEIFTLENVPPRLLSIQRLDPLESVTNANTLRFQAIFDEPVMNVVSSSFTVVGPKVNASVSQVTPQIYHLTVTGANVVHFVGTVGIDLRIGHSIIDLYGNHLPTIEPWIDETYSLFNEPDFGDAPDIGPGTGTGNYQTTLSDNGPRHNLFPELKLGGNIDAEADGVTRDDLYISPEKDDEDGVYDTDQDLLVTVDSITQVRLRITNTIGSTATLFGWIDFNRDGVFDNLTERSSVTVPTASNNVVRQLTFPPVPASVASTGRSYARFRLSTDAAAANAFGPASNGEVEDYPVSISFASPGTVDSSKTVKIASSTNGGPGLANNDVFGFAITSIGDLDGDGIPDQVVAAERDDTGGVLQSGAVFVQFMNADRTVRSNVKIANNLNGGPSLLASDYFGTSVTSLGDLDGDGFPEVAVGLRGYDSGTLTDSGAVEILYLRSDGTAKSSTRITSGVNGGPSLQIGDVFGQSVASIGDLDGDGITDLAVGASSDDGGTLNANQGAVYLLFLNNNGSVKNSQRISGSVFNGPTLANGDEFGRSLSTIGDFDADGFTDLAVGAHLDDTGGTNRGAVYIVRLNNPANSSSIGPVKSTTKIAHANNGGPTLANSDFFGRSVATLGDVNGDNVNDLIVGAHQDDTGGSARGAAYLLLMTSSGTVGNSLKIAHSLNGGPSLVDNDAFGNAVALLGDLDGDGVNEFAVAANNDDTGGINRGAVYIFSLNALTVQTSFTGSVDENSPVNSSVGNFVTSFDASNTYTYSLITGFGSTHNSSFTLSPTGALSTNSILNYETNPTRTIRVRSIRQDGVFFANAYTIVVNNVNERPTANAGGARTIDEGVALTFNGTGTDPDTGTTLSYEWDFDYDGSVFDVDASIQSPSVTLLDGPATRTVALRVTDNGTPALASLISTATVTISNLPPVLTRASAIVNGSVLSTLTNSGTWSDVIADSVMLGASLGTVVKNFDGTWSWSYTPTIPLADQTVTIIAADEDGGESQVTFTVNAHAAVVNRQVFYNRSTSSIFGDGSGNPIDAIDTTKQGLLPGQTSSSSNYTNYSRGLNGLVVDIAGLSGTPTAADFAFDVWDGIDSVGFVPTTAMATITVLSGVGDNGSTRIKIEFADYAVRNQWLRVTTLANTVTGLAADDVFYFGNAVADMYAGNVGAPFATVLTNATDTSIVRQNQSITANSVLVTSLHDVNKDGRVNATDTSIVRQNQLPSIMRHFTAPASLQGILGKSSFVDGALSTPAVAVGLSNLWSTDAKRTDDQIPSQLIPARSADSFAVRLPPKSNVNTNRLLTASRLNPNDQVRPSDSSSSCCVDQYFANLFRSTQP